MPDRRDGRLGDAGRPLRAARGGRVDVPAGDAGDALEVDPVGHRHRQNWSSTEKAFTVTSGPGTNSS